MGTALGTEPTAGWPGDAGWGVPGLSTTGVSIAGVRIAGEDVADASVTDAGLAGVVGAGAMAGTIVAGEVVAEETEIVAAAAWVAVDRDTEPVAVSVSWILDTPESACVPAEPPLQAANATKTKAVMQPRVNRVFSERIIEVVIIRCRIRNP